MQEMGVNTVRVYITLHDDFYNAFLPSTTPRAEANEEPPGLSDVWVNDYSPEILTATPTIRRLSMRLSRTGARWSTFCTATSEDLARRGTGSGFYNKDVSCWVIGYILGVE